MSGLAPPATVCILHTMVYQSHTSDWRGDAVAEALFGKARREILALLFGQGGGEFYLRQIALTTGLAVRSVQRELENLVEAGLVERTARGNQVWFRANQQSPVHADLVGLMTRTVGVAGQVRAALLPLATRGAVEFAFIYGSFALGDQQGASDVDLMVIGRVKLQALAPALRPVEERLGREVNATIYPRAEFVRLARADRHFLRRVLGGPRVMLVGSDDELARMAGEPLAHRTRHQSGRGR